MCLCVILQNLQCVPASLSGQHCHQLSQPGTLLANTIEMPCIQTHPCTAVYHAQICPSERRLLPNNGIVCCSGGGAASLVPTAASGAPQTKSRGGNASVQAPRPRWRGQTQNDQKKAPSTWVPDWHRIPGTKFIVDKFGVSAPWCRCAAVLFSQTCTDAMC